MHPASSFQTGFELRPSRKDQGEESATPCGRIHKRPARNPWTRYGPYLALSQRVRPAALGARYLTKRTPVIA